jgi:hypothetical protein
VSTTRGQGPIVVGDFLIRNPHIHYHDWRSFDGQTAVERAVKIVATAPVVL